MYGDMMVSNIIAYEPARTVTITTPDNGNAAVELREQEAAAKEARKELMASQLKDVAAVSEEGDTVQVSAKAKESKHVLVDNADGQVAKKNQPELYDLIGYTRDQIKGFYIEGRISRYDLEKDNQKRDALAEQLSNNDRKEKVKEENRKELREQMATEKRAQKNDNQVTSEQKRDDQSALEQKRIINSKVEKARLESRIKEARRAEKKEEKEMENRRSELSEKFDQQRKAIDKNASKKVQSKVDSRNKVVRIQNKNEVRNGLMNRHSQEEGFLWDFQLEA